MTVQTLLQAAGNADYDFKDIPIMYGNEASFRTVIALTDSYGCTFSDMKDAASPDPSVRRQLASVVRDACINVGFFYGIAWPQGCI